MKNLFGFGSDLLQILLPDGLSAKPSCNAGNPPPAGEGLFHPSEQGSSHRCSFRWIHPGAQWVPNPLPRSPPGHTNSRLRARNHQEQLSPLPPSSSWHGDALGCSRSSCGPCCSEKCLGDLEPFNETGNINYSRDINNPGKAGYENIWFCALPYGLMAPGQELGELPALVRSRMLRAVSRVLWICPSTIPCQLRWESRIKDESKAVAQGGDIVPPPRQVPLVISSPKPFS